MAACARLAVLIGADVVLAYSNEWTWVWLGVSLWGLHMGITQGLLATMVADAAPATCAEPRSDFLIWSAEWRC